MAVQESAAQLSMTLKVQEYPTLKVPYETLNKRFRAAQKNIDRETSHVTMVVAELEKTLSSCPAVDSVVSLLDGVVEKLSVLKRKAVESIQAEDESAKLCKRRIEHLKEHSSDQPAAASMWKRKRMDRMMVEHLLRCGYYNTAVKLARQSGIEDLVNIEMFLTAKEVEESLERRETATCLAWCHDNKSRLRKMKVCELSRLVFWWEWTGLSWRRGQGWVEAVSPTQDHCDFTCLWTSGLVLVCEAEFLCLGWGSGFWVMVLP